MKSKAISALLATASAANNGTAVDSYVQSYAQLLTLDILNHNSTEFDLSPALDGFNALLHDPPSSYYDSTRYTPQMTQSQFTESTFFTAKSWPDCKKSFSTLNNRVPEIVEAFNQTYFMI